MTRSYRRIWSGTVAMAAGLSAGAQAGPQSSDAQQAIVERVRADVARLAGDEWQGRRAGTEGADRAADWIADQFRRIGLAPGAAGGSYFQTFTFIDGVVLGAGNRLS